MSQLKYLALSLVAGLVLSGCSEEKESNAQPEPEIIKASTTIRTNDLAYSAHLAVDNQFTIVTGYVAELSDSQGIDDIVYAEIQIDECDCVQVVHDVRAGADDDHINEHGVLSSSFYYNSSNLHTRAVGGMTLRVVDSDGNEATAPIANALLEPEISSGKTFVYSSEYTGDKTGGYEGLSVTTAVSGTINTTNQSIAVDFDLIDDRVESVIAWFCVPDGSSGNRDVFGSKTLLASGDLSVDATTQLIVQWDDVVWDGYTFDDYNKTGAGIQFYAKSHSITDTGVLSGNPVFASITDCIALSKTS